MANARHEAEQRPLVDDGPPKRLITGALARGQPGVPAAQRGWRESVTPSICRRAGTRAALAAIDCAHGLVECAVLRSTAVFRGHGSFGTGIRAGRASKGPSRAAATTRRKARPSTRPGSRGSRSTRTERRYRDGPGTWIVVIRFLRANFLKPCSQLVCRMSRDRIDIVGVPLALLRHNPSGDSECPGTIEALVQ
jgi:hypothetical protein